MSANKSVDRDTAYAIWRFGLASGALTFHSQPKEQIELLSTLSIEQLAEIGGKYADDLIQHPMARAEFENFLDESGIELTP